MVFSEFTFSSLKFATLDSENTVIVTAHMMRATCKRNVMYLVHVTNYLIIENL